MVTMTSLDEQTVEGALFRKTRSRTMNRITGTIIAGGAVPHRELYVKTDDGGSLNLRIDGCVSTPALQPYLSPGHRVLIAVDAAQVKLNPHRSSGSNEGNEWPGRVVLVEHDRTVITVKILGQQITLKSVSIDSGFSRPLRVWDSACVRIAPEAVHIVPLGTCARLRRRLLTEAALQNNEPSS